MTFSEEYASIRASVRVHIEAYLDMELEFTDVGFEEMMAIAAEFRALGYSDDVEIFAKMIRILPNANEAEIANALRTGRSSRVYRCA